MGSKESKRSKQCHHRRPDLECNTLKQLSEESQCMLGKAAIKLASQSRSTRLPQAPQHAFGQSIHEHILHVKYTKTSSLMYHIVAASAENRDSSLADVMTLSTPFILILLDSLCKWTCMQFYHSNTFKKKKKKKFYRSKTWHAAFPLWTIRTRHKENNLLPKNSWKETNKNN